MTHKSFRKVFIGFCLLASMPAGAQESEQELQLSNAETTCWYRIVGASAGMDGYAMTDYNGMTDAEEEFTTVFLLPTETESHHSQWKLTAGEEGKVILTNRATGNQIGNHSAATGNHNITSLTPSGAPGFTITSLGDNAFKLESVEDDGVNRCLALADISGEAISYPETDESTSAINWKFFPVEIQTGISTTEAGPAIIQVKDKRITVSRNTGWQLFNTQGEEMPRTVRLQTGVYMVRTQQGTVKVLIP